MTARRVYRVTTCLVLVVLAIAAAVVAIRWLLSGSPVAALGFLFDPTGWDIAYSILPFNKNDPYWWAFVVGVTNTVTAGMLGIAGATVLGFVTGLAPLAGSAT
jgi:ABC-type amino acid transport system permease subunit